ncbi:hypothetical protein N657DRAFT_464849 [Parathielavia appendiculata]|uniref:Uncharacterized protein n=1 Tax=Parathielavia appendiculata TaxID=2587402 RepID=A0AAN6TP27_9PEZI|nr:hypothetical protein N657DRAFT_464849 [Parathielavia appendiculata]
MPRWAKPISSSASATCAKSHTRDPTPPQPQETPRGHVPFSNSTARATAAGRVNRGVGKWRREKVAVSGQAR